LAAAVKPLVAGNWKMNGLRRDAVALAGALAERMRREGPPRCAVVVCPPAVMLQTVGEAIAGSGIGLGAQDCHARPSGAHTGDISAPMLADAGCSHVIVGHSERRADHDETDAMVRAKAAAAQGCGLMAIICVGETLAERDAGQALAVVRRQLDGSLPPGATAANTVIAYEPVWAIGTGRTPKSPEIAEVHAAIRAAIAGRVAGAATVPILYGGSVKAENAAEILAIAEVGGALVGGASLNAADFWTICRSCP